MACILAVSNAPASADNTIPDHAIKAPLADRSLLLDVCAAGNRLITVGERGHILLSDDNGKSWRQVDVPTQATLTGVYFLNKRLGWAVGHDAVILRTQDGGETWAKVHDAPEEECPLLDVLFLDERIGFAVGAYGYFLVSRDGGISWSSNPISQDDYHLNQIALSGDGRLYMAAEAGKIYSSEDQGTTWHELPSPYHGSFFGILPVKDKTLLVFGLRGSFFRSQDGGKTWKKIIIPTRAMLTDGQVLDNGRIVVVGLSGTVLISNDQGVHFSLKQQPDRKGISAIIPAGDGALVLVGEFGVRRKNLDG